MQSKKIGLKFEGKSFDIETIVCSNIFSKALGLMFSRREKAKALLFEFPNPVDLKIHSLFVNFPFIAIWLNQNNKIVDIKIVEPFKTSVSSKEYFSKLIEIPVNSNYSAITDVLVDKLEKFKKKN